MAYELDKYVSKDNLNTQLDEYRKKDDLTFKVINSEKIKLPIESKYFELERRTTDHVPFHEGAHLVGYVENYPNTTKFDIIFKTETTTTNSQNGGLIHWMYMAINDDGYRIQFMWDEITGAIADYNGTYPIIINLAEVEIETEIDDELVLKSDLNDYRKKDDLTVNTFIDLPIEHKMPTGRLHDFTIETAIVEFHEGAILEGYVMVYDAATEDYIHRDFTITFHTDRTDGDCHLYDILISPDVDGFWWEEDTNSFYAAGEVDIAEHLNSARIYIEDTFVLKFEVE